MKIDAAARAAKQLDQSPIPMAQCTYKTTLRKTQLGHGTEGDTLHTLVIKGGNCNEITGLGAK
jgi:hypothetical protein